MRRIIVCSFVIVFLIFGQASNIKAQTLTNADLEDVLRRLITVVEALQNQLREEQGLFVMIQTSPIYTQQAQTVIQAVETEDIAVQNQIAAPDLIVVSPRTNAIWNRGAKYAISWSMRDLEYPELRIINKGTGRVAYTVKLGRSTTRFVWAVPLSLETGIYTIQLSASDVKTGDDYLSQSATVIVVEEDMVGDAGFDVAL